MKAIIADDTAVARNLLRMMLSEIAPDIFIAAEASSLPDAVTEIRNHKPHVVFLDIEMPGRSGLDIFDLLPRGEFPVEIVFITAYDSYAVRAFRLSAVDYLLKPVREDELSQAVQKLRYRMHSTSIDDRMHVLRNNLSVQGRKQISIPAGVGGYETVYLDEIEYFEADGSYTSIHLVDGRQRTCSRNLKYFETLLSADTGFIRVHRSYLIRADRVSRFSRSERATITMVCGKVIDVARDRRARFFQVMDNGA